jgi:FtsH-binding integral membrane protein
MAAVWEDAPAHAEGGLEGLSEVTVRHGFIQKVFGIVGVQLAVTTTVAGVITAVGDSLVQTSPDTVLFLIFASLAIAVVLPCLFAIWPGLMRKSPTNYILLGLLTLSESVLVGIISIQYTQESVLIVLGITCLVAVGLTLFAFQTKYDFTGFGPYFCCGCLVLLGFSLTLAVASVCGIRGPAFEAGQVCYAALGALLFSGYIVFDAQMIIGGKHKHKFSVDDYAMAAITLYLDIIQLFIKLLRILGEPKKKNKSK